MPESNDFLEKAPADIRPLAEKIISSIRQVYDFDSDIKWGQLTFALKGDFDHWICAVSTTKKAVNIKFHFGSFLNDKHKVFAPDSGKFIRKIEIATESDINDKALHDLIGQAIKKYTDFKEHWKEMR